MSQPASASKSLTEDELVGITYNEYLGFKTRQHRQAEIDSIKPAPEIGVLGEQGNLADID